MAKAEEGLLIGAGHELNALGDYLHELDVQALRGRAWWKFRSKQGNYVKQNKIIVALTKSNQRYKYGRSFALP